MAPEHDGFEVNEHAFTDDLMPMDDEAIDRALSGVQEGVGSESSGNSIKQTSLGF